MLCSDATGGLIDIATYKRVIASWIRDMRKQHLHQPVSSFTASLTSSPLKSYSATFSSNLREEEFASPQHLQFSHESLEGEGGSFRESLDIVDMQQAVEQLKSENLLLKDQQLQLESYCELREDSLKKLQVERDTLEKKVRVFTQQLEQKDGENEDLRKQVADRERTSDLLNSKLQEVEQQRSSLERELGDLRLQLEESRNTVQILEERVSEVEGKESDHAKKLQERCVEYEGLEERFTSVAEDNHNLTQQLEEMRDENLSLQKECKMLESELEVTKAKMPRVPLHAPVLSSTPHLEVPISRQKSIREEIEDVSGKSRLLVTSPGDVGESPTQGGGDLEESLDQSFGSGVDTSLTSLDLAEIEEYASMFQQNKEQALQQIEELLDLDASFSLREHPSLRVNTSLDIPDVGQRWETLEQKLRKMIAERKKLQEKVRSYHNKISELKKELAELRERSRNDRTGELEEVLEQLKTECARLSQECSHKGEQIRSLNKSLQEKTKELLELQEEVDDLQKDNSEVHEECVKLEKKCTDQSNKIIRLATETGSAEQRTKELEGLLRESRDTHRSAMKTILDVVQERDSGEEGEQTDSSRQRTDDSFSEEDEILTVGHVSGVLKAKFSELKEQAMKPKSPTTPQKEAPLPVGPPPSPQSSHSTQTDPHLTSPRLTGIVLKDRVDIEPVPGGVKADRELVIEPVEVVEIPGEVDAGGPLRKVLGGQDQKFESSSNQSSICWRIFKAVLLFLFFVLLVLGLFVTLTSLSESRYCDEPCPSSISGLVYHTLHPYISVSHDTMSPL
jgi:chromosome segregation ATPase